MKVVKRKLAGVFEIQLEFHEDHRGFFMRTYDDEIFKKYDILISPTMPNIAPKFSEINKMTPLQNYMIDIMTAGPNLAGFPHLNIPSGFSKKIPTGLLVISDHFQEKLLIDFARWLLSRS